MKNRNGRILCAATVVFIVFAHTARAEGVVIDELLANANFERRWELYKKNPEMRAALVARANRVLRAGFERENIDAQLPKLEAFVSRNREYLSAMTREFDKLLASIDRTRSNIKGYYQSQNRPAFLAIESQFEQLGNVKRWLQDVEQRMSGAEFAIGAVAEGLRGGTQEEKKKAFTEALRALTGALNREFSNELGELQVFKAVNDRLGKFFDICPGAEIFDALLGRMTPGDRAMALAAITEIEHLKYRKLWLIAEDVFDIFAEPPTNEQSDYTEAIEFMNDNRIILNDILKVFEAFRGYMKWLLEHVSLQKKFTEGERGSVDWTSRAESFYLDVLANLNRVNQAINDLNKFDPALNSISEQLDKLLLSNDWKTLPATLDFENRTLKALKDGVSKWNIREYNDWTFLDFMKKEIGTKPEESYGLKFDFSKPLPGKVVNEYLNKVFIPLLDYKIKKKEDFEKRYFARPGTPPPASDRPVPPECPSGGDVGSGSCTGGGNYSCRQNVGSNSYKLYFRDPYYRQPGHPEEWLESTQGCGDRDGCFYSCDGSQLMAEGNGNCGWDDVHPGVPLQPRIPARTTLSASAQKPGATRGDNLLQFSPSTPSVASFLVKLLKVYVAKMPGTTFKLLPED